MSSDADSESSVHRDALSRATSDLNNALQVISVSASLIDDAWRGSDRSDEYLALLRNSVARAEQVAAEFVKEAGGARERMLMHPQLAGTTRRPVPVSPGNEQCILLVDDDMAAVLLMKRILVEAGFRVVSAHSGFECLDLFRGSPHVYDLVILDMNMPLLDGEETFHRLRNIRPDVPVILCAGFVQQEKLNRLITAGLAGLLRKPLAPNEIVDHVRATLETLKYSSRAADAEISPAAI
ncbi:MAG TPA: response regulator [Chthoniobacterales bacterium]|jgi:CheY-like chemotaxis protein